MLGIGALGAVGTGAMVQAQQTSNLQSRIDSLEATNSDLSDSRLPAMEATLNQGIYIKDHVI